MSHRTPSLGPTPLRIERRCPGCGAELRYSEADHAAACGHCGLHVAVLRRDGVARFAIRARGDEASWSLAAKRLLRDRGVRLRELSIPWLVYAPFYRLSASIHSWWRTGSNEARAELAEVAHGEDAWPAWVLSGMVSAFHETSANAYTRTRPRMQAPREAEQSVHFRIGDWEQTLDGAPSIDLGDRSLGVRSRALPVTPIEELVGETDAETTPARLACELDPAEARRRLELSLAEAQRPIDCDPDVARAVVRQRPMQVIYHPYVVVEYRGPDGDGAAILDGLTARPRALLDLIALDRLRGRLEARPGEPSAWSFAGPDESLSALVCDRCTAPLDCPAGAKLFVCPLCHRVFGATHRGIHQVAAIGLRAPVGAVRGARPRSLPFYRFTVPVEAGPVEAGPVEAGPVEAAPRTVFVPAALAQHPRALWSLSAAFSRRGREWRDGDPDDPVETPIALSPEDARPLLPFLWSLAFDEPELEDDRVARAVIELVWISVVRRGRDWVEPSSGLGVASSALGAWSVEPRV